MSLSGEEWVHRNGGKAFTHAGSWRRLHFSVLNERKVSYYMISCIHVALLLVLFYPCREMAVNFSDYLSFLTGFCPI